VQNLSRAEHLAAWLCGTGLLLGIAGYWAMWHVPMSPEEEEKERLLQEVFIPAARQAAREHPDNPQLQLMLEELQKASIRQQRPPPYREVGILGLSTGIAAFAIGVCLWFGSSGRWRPSRWVKANEDA
jgi:hypothetical protein